MNLSFASRLLIGLFIILYISSCSISEELWFESNGSGKMEMFIDMGSMFSIFSMLDTSEIALGEEKMDSTINFGQAIKEENLDLSGVKNAHLLDRISMDMYMDEANEDMTIKMTVAFDNIEQVDDIMTAMDEVSAIRKESNGEDNNPMGKATTFLGRGGLGFSFQKGSLVRETQFLDDELTEEELDPSDLKVMQSMFGNMTYSTIIHLPGKIKKVTIDNAEMVDNKTIRIDYNLLDLMEASELPGYEIKFKKK